jgi:Mg-chelatase subunit ChlD
MASWATRRKLQYFGIIALAFLLFVGLPFYIFIYQKPTCFDGFKNGSELGIDCGGACRLLCSKEVSEPVSRWDPRIFQVSPGIYTALAYFENPNVTGEVLSAPYTFRLYDKDGVLITDRKGVTFIPKGNTFAVFEGNIKTGERIPVRATFDFDNKLSWTKNLTQDPDISITNKALTKEDTTPRVEATVSNKSLDAVPNIELIAIIFDGSGNAIGASRTFLENLNKGESQNVVFTWPTPFVTKSDVCESPVDIALVLDRSGSMASLGDNPPQPLTDVKNAANTFVNLLTKNDQATVVSFATDASNPIDANLSSDFNQVKLAIGNISIHTEDGLQNTNIADGLLKAENELLGERGRQNAGKVIVMLTDGVANRPEKVGDTKYPENYAFSVAQDAKNNGIGIFTIGLGKDLHTDFLKQVASSSDEFFLAPTAKDLSGIYKQIATKLCKRKPAVIEIIPRIYPKNP